MKKRIENIINTILCREMFLNYTLFYLIFKYTFFGMGTFFTYLLFAYAVLIFIRDIFDNKGIYMFPGWQFSYSICISIIISCLVVAHKINASTIRGLSIFFINFFMYLPLFFKKDLTYIVKQFEKIFVLIIFYSFIKNIIGIFLAFKGIYIEDFFGSVYGGIMFGEKKQRLVTVRETANETAWFAVFSIVSSLYFIVKPNIKETYKAKLFLYVNIIVQIITYILSGNRSSFVGAMIALIVIAFSYCYINKKKNIMKLSIFISVCCVIALLVYLIIRIVFGIGSDSIRFELYLYGILLLKYTNPVFGSSFINLNRDLTDNFEKIWGSYNFKTSKSYLKELILGANAHNVFIQQLNTNGILGVAILISFFLWVFLNVIDFIKKVYKEKIPFLYISILLFFIVFGFVVGNISWSIIGTMTCFVNLMFFLSISAITNFCYCDKRKI